MLCEHVTVIPEAIIHLRTPSLSKGYNYQNSIRIETAEEAALIDEKIHHVWRDHPNYRMIESTDSFLDKVAQAYERIQAVLPACCKGHFEK